MHACNAHPTASAGRGGQACRRAAGWVRRGEGGGRPRILLGGGGGQAGRGGGWGGGAEASARPHARQLGVGSRATTLCHHPRVGGRSPPMCMPAQVGGIGPPPLHASAQAEAAVGVAPLRPTPAPLPIEGLWVCCETAAPGGGLGFSSTVHHSTQGLGRERGGGGRATVASAVGPVPAHLGQGAWNTTCTLRRCRHASTSARTASHARAWASPPARGYQCCGDG